MKKKMNLQDFSVVSTKIKKIKDDLELRSMSDAFYFIAISQVLDLQEDEIMDAITDNSFLRNQEISSGHDRGIDAIVIDNERENPIVHIFNCKYTEKFEKAKEANFPSGEIDKIGSYFRALMQMDRTTINNSNKILKEKTEEIWGLFTNHIPEFKVHLCSNLENGLQDQEKIRLLNILSEYNNIEIIEHTNLDYAIFINNEKRVMANAKFRANGKELFEKTDGDIRALVVNVSAEELMRMITDDDDYRNNVEIPDYSELKDKKILEDIFYDNVRMYKKKKNRINDSIKQTAKTEEKNKFFYYNNGITITCKSFAYQKNAQPVISLEEIQVVNGSQTLHALFDIAKENSEYLDGIEILCRIYELKNSVDSSHIAEYTNSQNPVTTRDIRAIDVIQQLLDTEFHSMGYFYERKKNQYEDQPKNKRIDAEKAGQALMAFYNDMPGEAKNDKKLIFGDKYEVIFNNDINASKVLLAYKIYEEIEKRRNIVRREIARDIEVYEEKSHILYSSYYILYILSKIASIKVANEGLIMTKENIIQFYDMALLLIKKVVKYEKENNPKYTNADFFKTSKPKTYVDNFLKEMGDEATTEKIESIVIAKMETNLE